TVVVPEELATRFSIGEDDVLQLARWSDAIEKHYSAGHDRTVPMDIEWAKDGLTGKLYIVQARPETVQSRKRRDVLVRYHLDEEGETLLVGRSIGDRIGSGDVHVIKSIDELSSFRPGEVLVAEMTDPDWEPIMKCASAIITNRGGRTCHAAIVSRELGVPCIVGTRSATSTLTDGQPVTVDCSQGAAGKVLSGKLSFSRNEILLDLLPKTKTQLLVNAGNPEHAFALSQLPVAGVGLAREEFIIANEVKIHPMALVKFNEITDLPTRKKIEQLTAGYKDKQTYFVRKLAEGIGMIAAAFYPRQVIVRLSDFKTNEYASLIGGSQFEPLENNPMIGFRGASRYYSERYKAGFALECRALKFVRADMGLTNVKIMVPFCRTVEEARLVIQQMRINGLIQHDNGLEFYMMCEVPSNVVLMDQFAQIFDGFSIGSNDLTQLLLGVDRDSEILSPLFDERDPAVLKSIKEAIAGAHGGGRKIGICGQAPSDYPEMVQFLIDCGIDTISLNEDAVTKTLLMVANSEQKTPASSSSSSSSREACSTAPL
ncbi:MAG TPA: phosphoenolpyruvate synthase, partial [Chroococcales cyanobacterium]